MKHNVLILRTGHSCRSQMAEAIVNARLGEIAAQISAYLAAMIPASDVPDSAGDIAGSFT